jgi:uncharacterized membrane protein YtjA (UPF0391 family)
VGLGKLVVAAGVGSLRVVTALVTALVGGLVGFGGLVAGVAGVAGVVGVVGEVAVQDEVGEGVGA